MLVMCLLWQGAAASDPWQDAERATWESPGFLAAHPDVMHRKRGLARLEQGETERALQEFRRAAEYSDKASQAMLGELYWQGRRVGRDRARGYAWMDLAAERGYPHFVRQRERYWHALDAAARAEALRLGAELHAQYGDAAAQPRLAKVLRRHKPPMLGALGLRPLTLIGADGAVEVSRMVYYDRRYWEPELYFAWTDATWRGEPHGTVEVGPLRGGNSE
jgi:uncharacterized protein